MVRKWHIRPGPPQEAEDGDIWEESDEYDSVVEFERIKEGKGLTDEDGKDVLYRHMAANEELGDDDE